MTRTRLLTALAAASAVLATAALTACPTSPDDPDCDAAATAPTVDGAFTGWPSCAAHEWSTVEPVEGLYTWFYADYREDRFHLLNDWHLRTVGPVPAGAWNRFDITTGSGATTWEVLVFADGRVDVVRDGVPLDPDEVQAEGAAGFGRSPKVDVEHTIWELSFIAAPGDWEVKEADPDNFGELVDEPTVFRGTADPDGGTTLTGEILGGDDDDDTLPRDDDDVEDDDDVLGEDDDDAIDDDDGEPDDDDVWKDDDDTVDDDDPDDDDSGH